mmetsp:Transcript_112629/g.319392  ORF Transcript_112629/g.319392 Transcript_112629/m.319392 type:complete len:219 (-) Transcript_112629:167-823(-)
MMSPSMSSRVAGRDAVLETLITLAYSLFFSKGRTLDTKAKWPKWLMPNCCSKPFFVSWRCGIAMTPALFIKTSIFVPTGRASYLPGKDLMLAKSAKSSCTWCTSLLPDASLICSTAFTPFSAVLAVITTVAPALASRTADSNPKPVLPPVMTTVRPLNEPAGGENTSMPPSMRRVLQKSPNATTARAPTTTFLRAPPASSAARLPSGVEPLIIRLPWR